MVLTPRTGLGLADAGFGLSTCETHARVAGARDEISSSACPDVSAPRL